MCENSPQLKIIINLLISPVCLDADGPEEFPSGELQTVTDEVRDWYSLEKKEKTDVWSWNKN